jgi:isoquinoline 1-oxidoreductase alpha subunit
MTIRLTVDGQPRALEVDPEMPLLWALRDVLGITAVKYGCGMALCGACTVHVDGHPVRSCVLPVGRVTGAVTTLAGLSPHGDHPVQRAWIELGVAQCGFCQAGQIMTAAALLAARPEPSDDDIDHALDGNLCRCGSYPRVRAAVHRAAALSQVGGRGGGRDGAR